LDAIKVSHLELEELHQAVKDVKAAQAAGDVSGGPVTLSKASLQSLEGTLSAQVRQVEWYNEEPEPRP
jgi:ABC-type uncharacterized transport system YnjBCD substrate-binding protein